MDHPPAGTPSTGLAEALRALARGRDAAALGLVVEQVAGDVARMTQ